MSGEGDRGKPASARRLFPAIDSEAEDPAAAMVSSDSPSAGLLKVKTGTDGAGTAKTAKVLDLDSGATGCTRPDSAGSAAKTAVSNGFENRMTEATFRSPSPGPHAEASPYVGHQNSMMKKQEKSESRLLKNQLRLVSPRASFRALKCDVIRLMYTPARLFPLYLCVYVHACTHRQPFIFVLTLPFYPHRSARSLASPSSPSRTS